MQIYEPYANEGIPRLIAHKMEALWVPPPFQCALTPPHPLNYSPTPPCPQAPKISSLPASTSLPACGLLSGLVGMSEGQHQLCLLGRVAADVPANPSLGGHSSQLVFILCCLNPIQLPLPILPGQVRPAYCSLEPARGSSTWQVVAPLGKDRAVCGPPISREPCPQSEAHSWSKHADK